MDNSRVLLFVVPGASSRSVAAMCEAAYHIGRQASSVVLCLQRMTGEAAEQELNSIHFISSRKSTRNPNLKRRGDMYQLLISLKSLNF